MESRGKVLRVEGEYAFVAVKRRTACQSCQSDCNSCSRAGEVTAKVKNVLSAEVGDEVKIYSDSKVVLGLAALVFVLPVAVALIFYFVPRMIWHNELAALAVSFAGFVLCFVGIYIAFGKKTTVRNTMIMTEILAEAQDGA